VIWTLLACSHPEPGSWLAWVHTEAGSEVAPRALPGLTDTYNTRGAYAVLRAGGSLSIDLRGNWSYRPGRAVQVDYEVVDGVAWPIDEQGLLSWSFYGHLADTAIALDELGLGIGTAIPIDAAWVPTLPSLDIELVPAENAAYATGQNVFVLLPDLIDADVPLVANAGVVAHETGHCLFHLLTTGDVVADPLFDDPTSEAWLYQASLHEGFADIVATMITNDPHFIEESINMGERRVDGDTTADDVVLPEQHLIDSEGQLLAIYDPYALGTVFASLAWDLRLLVDDGAAVLQIAGDAAESWAAGAESGWDEEDRWSFADALVAGTPEDVRVEACSAAALRLPGVALAACP
jgi:hypothetical protein